MNSSEKAEHDSERAGQSPPPAAAEEDVTGSHWDTLSQTFAACTRAYDHMERAHAELEQRLGEFAAEFVQVQAALRREQIERTQLETETRRLRAGVARAETGQLAAQVREKEVLLREIHHRVNNNLQTIISLFHLQLDRLTEPRTRALFLESQNRVYAMALIHEKLYRARDEATIDFAEYVRSLTAHVFRSYGVAGDSIELFIDADDIGFGIETMIPCALILNELVSNALKYAFPEGRTGRIEVRLRPLGENRYQLVVGDDGVGMPPGMDVRNTDSLGMQIVTALCEQLEGTLSVSAAPGTTMTIAFQEQKTKPRSTGP